MSSVKRFLVFAVLGPPLGHLTALWGILPIFNAMVGNWRTYDYWLLVDYHQVVVLPVAYMVGLLPACLVGLFDVFLAKRGSRRPVLWCTLLGFGVSFLPLLPALAMAFIHGPFVLIFGLLGAVPAGVCAWLAEKWAGRIAD
jgi:hypothetical protein